jgi:hypothetical protein
MHIKKLNQSKKVGLLNVGPSNTFLVCKLTEGTKMTNKEVFEGPKRTFFLYETDVKL